MLDFPNIRKVDVERLPLEILVETSHSLDSGLYCQTVSAGLHVKGTGFLYNTNFSLITCPTDCEL
jgi:hypothetical protein